MTSQGKQETALGHGGAPETLGASFREAASALNPANPNFAVEVVDLILRAAQGNNASDIHLTPNAEALSMRWRVDGVLHHVADLPVGLAKNIAARLKVLADLLTYRTDLPQEGRIRGDARFERRVSTFPTLFGENVVIRLFAEQRRLSSITDLGFPDTIREHVLSELNETSGALIVAGPAGSGKTTTLYAALRWLTAQPGSLRSIASLEDPIETVVQGVAQSQVNPHAGFDLASGLRSLMRQDPEVIAIGEIRDASTAAAAVGAALTGHLVLTTFHAGSGAGAIRRLLDMGIEPYAIRSGVRAVLAQRLVRALCECAIADNPDNALGLAVNQARRPVGCDRCRGTGYVGRLPIVEFFSTRHENVARAILASADVSEMHQRARQSGMVGLLSCASAAVEAGFTSAAEVRRVLGYSQTGVADRD